MFFSYANFQHSQKHNCHEIYWHTLFPECFWSRSKNSQHVFIGSKTTRLRLVPLNPIKHSCSFFKHYETSRHFSTRIKEHTESDKNSRIFEHFNTSPLCKYKYSPACFSILDSASNPIDLKLKEAFYINKIKPELNKQLQHYNTFLMF